VHLVGRDCPPQIHSYVFFDPTVSECACQGSCMTLTTIGVQPVDSLSELFIANSVNGCMLREYGDLAPIGPIFF